MNKSSVHTASRWLLVLAATTAFLAACNGKNNSSEKPSIRKVKAYKIEQIHAAALEAVPGNVRPKLHATIEGKVSARIEKIQIVEGQAVEAGQLLAQLDANEIQAKLDQAIAVRDQTKKEMERFSVLVRQEAATRQELDAIQAKALVAAAAVAEAQTMLGYTTIIAPFKGVITRKLVNVGDLAAPGRALFDIEDPSILRFEAAVPETFLANVRIGETFKIDIPPSLDQLLGMVAEVSSIIDPNSRTFLIKLDLPLRDDLRSGQFGHVGIPAQMEATISIPVSALIRRGQMELVYVIENGQAHLRLVRSGKVSGDKTQLVSGIATGELVVIDPAAELRDGQQVEVTP